VKEGLSKVPLHRTPNKRAILREQWPVEPKCLAQGGTVRFRGFWENHRHGVTREMEQQKGDERNAEAHHQEPQQPA
jgi:hypothetical protein